MTWLIHVENDYYNLFMV